MEENFVIDIPSKMFDKLEEIADEEGMFLDDFILKNLCEHIYKKYGIDLTNLD